MNTLKTVKIVNPNGKHIEKTFRVNNVQDLNYITGYIQFKIMYFLTNSLTNLVFIIF